MTCVNFPCLPAVTLVQLGGFAVDWKRAAIAGLAVDWKRAAIAGLAVWLLPFAMSVLLFGIRGDNRALFESLITVIGVSCAVAATLWYFRGRAAGDFGEGVLLGVAWATISIAIDLPIFLAVFRMAPPDYLADVALTYLAFPVITVGMFAARRQMRAGGL